MHKETFLKRNGLSITLAILFMLFMAGQIFFGWHEYNDDQLEHSRTAIGLADYMSTGHFWEATAENWESEFLQMAAYILLTVRLFQKGSSESKKLEGGEAVDRDPARSRNNPDAPWPVRRGGIVLKLYECSLSIAFVLLFLVSIAMHAIGGAASHNEERIAHGEAPVSVLDYASSSAFWFESFQNWQSEFLALLAMVVLSIYLRQRGSPESKPVDAPHDETGGG